MPPLTIVEYQPDGRGGWYVQFHDDANLDGDPLDAFFHVEVAQVDELCRVREHLRAPENELSDAAATLGRDRATMQRRPADPGSQRRELEIPDGVVPYADRDWLAGYESHVGECIDRIRLNVAGHAPHALLEEARQGGTLPERWQRAPATRQGIRDFAIERTENR